MIYEIGFSRLYLYPGFWKTLETTNGSCIMDFGNNWSETSRLIEYRGNTESIKNVRLCSGSTINDEKLVKIKWNYFSNFLCLFRHFSQSFSEYFEGVGSLYGSAYCLDFEISEESG